MQDSIGLAVNGLRRTARHLVTLAVPVVVCALGSPAHADPQHGIFVIFDIPGSGGPAPNGITPGGAVTGSYGIGPASYGFLRVPDGTIITIAVPGSTSTFLGSGGPIGANAGPPINPAGAITGSFNDASGTHGFVRAPDGIFTRFDAPGAVSTDFVCCITPEGAISGIAFDATGMGHGFVRAPNGTFTVFDPPGSAGTVPNATNPVGVIIGAYFDASFVEHGFLRATDGTITTFDAPGAVDGTLPTGINPAGVITGTSFDNNFVGHGFVRAADGSFTTFDVPGSEAPFGTNGIAINPRGAIVGGYFGGSMFHGFVRAPDGSFTPVDPTGSASTGIGAINPAGVIAGSYSDAGGAVHGFLFIPRPCC
jgi:hypothetical protein